MRVLIINTVPTERNGITGVIFNFLNHFESNNFEFDLVSINYPNKQYVESLKKKGGKIIVLNRSLKNALRYVYGLVKIMNGYDIIHVHGNSATMVLEMIAGKLAGVNIRIAHSHNSSCSLFIVHKIVNPLFQYLCNGRIACSDVAGKWLFGNRKFHIINNGIDTARFVFNDKKRQNLRDELGWNDCIIIGHVGNFDYAKNHSFILDVFYEMYKLNSKSRLLLLGGGDNIKIKEKTQELGITHSIYFAGSVPEPERYLSAMDLILMPSFFEGLPLTLIEEQANGLKCIVSDTITKQVDLSGNIEFMSLKMNPVIWATEALKLIADKAVSREEQSSKACKNICNSGYDINTEVVKLMKIYMELSNHK